ncbi:MAG: hypothetical protein A2Y15_09080 [Clostridiales bacterium GWF2_36_10]|nr:MAG: hypothetical protein A2Y15_09080 [Clostridiales bacterium GWF2_36_10]HAN21468.1 type III pantothenate kinase [Clostridiales bacterium]
MILAIDIGNTGTAFGFYDNATLCHHIRISSIPHKSIDEYTMILNTYCMQKKIDISNVEGCVISSVVPPITEQIKQAVENVISCKPLIITHGVKTGLNIRIDNQTQLGSDIVANAVAAASVLQKPFTVIDLGTATTVSAVNSLGELYGVIIIPGVRLSVDILSATAAELPYISLGKPKSLLGKNTNDSMLSGCIYGTAAMLDGIIERVKEDLGAENLSVIACGGLADKIIPFCQTDISINPYLTLEGLVQLYRLNQRKNKSV